MAASCEMIWFFNVIFLPACLCCVTKQPCQPHCTVHRNQSHYISAAMPYCEAAAQRDPFTSLHEAPKLFRAAVLWQPILCGPVCNSNCRLVLWLFCMDTTTRSSVSSMKITFQCSEPRTKIHCCSAATNIWICEQTLFEMLWASENCSRYKRRYGIRSREKCLCQMEKVLASECSPFKLFWLVLQNP